MWRRGVAVLVEAVLEAEAQRMMEALMGACAGVIPDRKVYLFEHYYIIYKSAQ